MWHLTQSPGILIFHPPPKMNSYNAFIEYATSLSVKSVFEKLTGDSVTPNQ